MDYLFRHGPDGTFAFNMLMVRLGLIIFLLVIYKFRKNDILLKVLLTLSLILQALLFSWYTKDKNILFLEGLPLYHCRIAGLLLPITYLLKKDTTMTFFADLAIIGTIIAFAVPDPSRYKWPHITNITYILNHYVLIACGMLVSIKSKKFLNFREIFTISLMMNIIILLVDIFLGANYGYLVKVPVTIFEEYHFIIIFAAMSALMIGGIFLFEDFRKKFLINNLPKL